MFYVKMLNVNDSCSSLELTFLESGNQQLSIFIVNKWITRIVFIFKLFYYIQFWPVNMTGKSNVWPVKASIRPDIVRWPAVIFSPVHIITVACVRDKPKDMLNVTITMTMMMTTMRMIMMTMLIRENVYWNTLLTTVFTNTLSDTFSFLPEDNFEACT